MNNIIKIVFFTFSFLLCMDVHAKKIEIDATTKIVESISSDKNVDYTAISSAITSLEEQLKSGQYNAELLSDSVKQLNDYRSELALARKQNEKELQFIQKRIEALGEATDDEVESISLKRKTFIDEASQQKAFIAEADVMLAKLDELDNLILNLRNKELIGGLIVQKHPIIMPHNFFHATSLLFKLTVDIIKSPINWYNNLDATQQTDMHNKFIPATLIFIGLLWLAIYLRLTIMNNFGYKSDARAPRLGKKVIAAFLVAVAYGVIPAILIAGFMAWMYSSKVVDGSFFGIVLNIILLYLLIIFIAKAVTRVIFAPYNPRWRLVNLDDIKAKKITNILYLAIISICLCAMLSSISIAANYSFELVSFLSIISSALKGIFIIWLTKILLLDDVSTSDVEEEEDTDDSVQMATVSKKVRISFVTIATVSIIFIVSLFGYAQLSAFIFNRLIYTVLIISALVLSRKLISEFFHHMLFFKFWFKTFRVRRKVRLSIDFWINFILDPLFVLLGIFVILSVWGVSTDILLFSLKKIFTGFKVGGINISLIAIALGIVSFYISLTLFKLLRTKFFNQVLIKMKIEEGVRHSLSSVVSFLGFSLALIIGVSAMGVDLTNLAIIASALSVGIGFGLQNIINNFVSGIIILFERPFKVGDWVIYNGEEGKIKQINIRSTEIETFKRASIIIPNATLLSSAVTNLTHENNWSRQSLTISVAYGSDVDKVRDILLEIANNHKLVLKNPAPYIVFKDFGASSLDFDLRCYTDNLWDGWSIPSDLRFEIYKRFNEEGIEIPFQQIVVHNADK